MKNNDTLSRLGEGASTAPFGLRSPFVPPQRRLAPVRDGSAIDILCFIPTHIWFALSGATPSTSLTCACACVADPGAGRASSGSEVEAW
jgi:hypothetical protein